MFATLTICCWPLPMVVSVSVTPGNFRASAAMRSASAEVNDRVDPSGARRLISNCDWSSIGRKFLPTNMNSGIVLTITITDNPTIAQRWPIDHSSIFVYARSMGR